MVKKLLISFLIGATSLTAAFADGHGKAAENALENASEAAEVAGNIADCIDGKDGAGNPCDALKDAAMDQAQQNETIQQGLEASEAIQQATE